MLPFAIQLTLFWTAAQRIITITVIAVATVAAASSVWFSALRLLGSASYLGPTGGSDADIIRLYWSHRFQALCGILVPTACINSSKLTKFKIRFKL